MNRRGFFGAVAGAAGALALPYEPQRFRWNDTGIGFYSATPISFAGEVDLRRSTDTPLTLRI